LFALSDLFFHFLDGYDDIVVGTLGNTVYLVMGQEHLSASSSFEMNGIGSTFAGLVFVGADASDNFGGAGLAGDVDINSDGLQVR